MQLTYEHSVIVKRMASLTLLPPYPYVLYWLLTITVRAVPAPTLLGKGQRGNGNNLGASNREREVRGSGTVQASGIEGKWSSTQGKICAVSAHDTTGHK